MGLNLEDVVIEITDRASKELSSRLSGGVAHFSVIKAGCVGYEFVLMEYKGDCNPNFEIDNIKMVIPQETRSILSGTETLIDFKDDKFDSGFFFKNSNMTNQCGCGKSLSFPNSSK